MKLAQVEKKLKKKVKEIFLSSVPRYYDHTLKVVANMKRIAKKIDDPQDRTILLMAAYLHDIGYSVPYRGDYVGNISHQALKIKLHSDVGAKVTEEILQTMGIEPELVRKVSYLVSVHHCEHIEDRYLNMLLQADKVRAPDCNSGAEPRRIGGG